MQRKGRVLNELSYKTDRQEERITQFARAPLFLSLLSQFGSSWSLFVLSPLCLSASCVISWNALLMLKMEL
jgi:hypothetical protein